MTSAPRSNKFANMSDWITLNWPAPYNVQARFTTRHGGMSSDPYASLNLADHVGDNPLIVKQNRTKLRRTLPGEPQWLKQVHGSIPIWVDNNVIVPEGDAALSRSCNVVCAVLTADCLPVFLCDDVGTVVGIVHAGWRGLVAGVIERTVTEMRGKNARIMAYLGPAIGPNFFEVGEKVRHAFIKQNEKSALAFAPHYEDNGKKWFADIFLLARQRLASIGVTKVYSNEECTFSNPERFFSYRRDGNTGRMAGLIWLTK